MHIDPEILALIALGEPAASPSESEHLAACALCRSELASLTAAAAAGRATASAPTLVVPHDRVWQGISASLGLSGAAAGAGDPAGASSSSEAFASVVDVPVVDVPEIGAATEVSAPASAPVIAGLPAPVFSAEPAPPRASSGDELASRRASRSSARRQRRPLRWLAVAAVVVVAAALGGVGTALALNGVGLTPSASPSSSILAATKLTALPAWQGATGDVVIEASGDSRSMTITVSDNTNRPDTYREVWLMNASLTKLVSIGLLATDSATFSIPAGIDMSVYTVVDVSSQPLDGNPAHSSNSIVRGSLAA